MFIGINCSDIQVWLMSSIDMGTNFVVLFKLRHTTPETMKAAGVDVLTFCDLSVLNVGSNVESNICIAFANLPGTTLKI